MPNLAKVEKMTATFNAFETCEFSELKKNDIFRYLEDDSYKSVIYLAKSDPIVHSSGNLCIMSEALKVIEGEPTSFELDNDFDIELINLDMRNEELRIGNFLFSLYRKENGFLITFFDYINTKEN